MDTTFFGRWFVRLRTLRFIGETVLTGFERRAKELRPRDARRAWASPFVRNPLSAELPRIALNLYCACDIEDKKAAPPRTAARSSSSLEPI